MNKPVIRHLIDTTDFSVKEIEDLVVQAKNFQDSNFTDKPLANKLVVNIFFENSTRTRSSFEVAAKRLGADFINFDIAKSSVSKGETLKDTAAILDAMGPSAIIVRHQNAGVASILAQYTQCSIVNGGEGAYAHPSQALLDFFTLKLHLGKIKDKRIGIVGDIKNSRVANSNIELLKRFGAKITLIAPIHFMPLRNDVQKAFKFEEVIDDLDVIMALRTQTERHSFNLYASLEDYALEYKITKELIADKNILVLHPGPVNRNIDIDDEVMQDDRCLVFKQVEYGVLMRMAILENLILK